jgi:hypothetical protein
MKPKKLNAKGNAGGVPSKSNPFLCTRAKRRFVTHHNKSLKKKQCYIRIPAERARKFIRGRLDAQTVLVVENSFVARRTSDIQSGGVS